MSHLKLVERDGPRPCSDKPCPGCPFLRRSMPGYLGGGYTPGSFLDQHYYREGVNPCHPTVDYAELDPDRDWRAEFVAGKNGRKCRGQAEFFRNSLKSPRNPDIQHVPKNPEVFSWPHEFLAHHGEESND